jgi:diguanylate cyclase (GGDEF)-like protein/PAS domain S-box-containing protein
VTTVGRLSIVRGAVARRFGRHQLMRTLWPLRGHTRMSSRDLATMLDTLPERLVRFRFSDLKIVYSNAAWAAFYDLEPSQVVGRHLSEFLSADGLVGLERQRSLLTLEHPVLADEVPREDLATPDHWVQWVDRLLPSGEVIAVGRDVTRSRRAERDLAASEARFRDLADHAADIVWHAVADPVPRFDYISPSAEEILGYPVSIFLEDANRFLDILDDDSRAMIAKVFQGAPIPERSDHRCTRPDSSVVIIETHLTVVADGWQGVSRDVTELRSLQSHLAELALHDPLTGLANRRLLDELLDAGLARVLRSGSSLAAVYLDLDQFKEVNDQHGHDAGDVVLQETARRLVSVARNADVVARVGGDEFIVVYEPGGADSEADSLMTRIRDALSSPIEISPGIEVYCHPSLGSADARDSGFDRVTLLGQADAAMYRAKQEQRRMTMHGAASR